MSLAGTSMDSAPSTLRTRSSLIHRLRDWSDERSWEEYYRLYRDLVFGFARKCGLTHEEADEATNDVFVRIAKTIHEFRANKDSGSFRGWLMTQARWRIADKFRTRPRDRNPPRYGVQEGTATLDRIPDPGEEREVWDREWQRAVLEAAMKRIARRTKPKHFQIFELASRQQWPAGRIARELGVSTAAVYLINHRLAKQLKAEVVRVSEHLH